MSPSALNRSPCHRSHPGCSRHHSSANPPSASAPRCVEPSRDPRPRTKGRGHGVRTDPCTAGNVLCQSPRFALSRGHIVDISASGQNPVDDVVSVAPLWGMITAGEGTSAFSCNQRRGLTHQKRGCSLTPLTLRATGAGPPQHRHASAGSMPLSPRTSPGRGAWHRSRLRSPRRTARGHHDPARTPRPAVPHHQTWGSYLPKSQRASAVKGHRAS